MQHLSNMKIAAKYLITLSIWTSNFPANPFIGYIRHRLYMENYSRHGTKITYGNRSIIVHDIFDLPSECLIQAGKKIFCVEVPIHARLTDFQKNVDEVLRRTPKLAMVPKSTYRSHPQTPQTNLVHGARSDYIHWNTMDSDTEEEEVFRPGDDSHEPLQSFAYLSVRTEKSRQRASEQFALLRELRHPNIRAFVDQVETNDIL